MPKWYYKPGHPKANERGFVTSQDYYEEEQKQALFAPICTDRFYENTSATDGTDIGSRRKHREYMKRHGLTVSTDYTETWKKAEKDREKIRSGEADKKERREQIERAWYGSFKP